MIYEKIVKRRTKRKYIRKDIPKEILIRCVDAARLSPTGANLQPLKYIIVNDKNLLTLVFKTIKWAGYLPNYKPNIDEMPTAYILILLDKNISKQPNHDAGIAAMSISMVAHDEGLGSCILGSIDREKIRGLLSVPKKYDIVLIVSLGYTSEKSIIEKMKGKDVRYWLDTDKVLHVPKRDFNELVKWNNHYKNELG
jgi:nitroreductase